MNPVRHLRRLAAALGWPAGVLLALATATPAFASDQPPPPLPPGWNKHPPLPSGHRTGPVFKAPVHTVVVGGMPGWQIALIALCAALLAAAMAVLAYRAWDAWRRATASTA